MRLRNRLKTELKEKYGLDEKLDLLLSQQKQTILQKIKNILLNHPTPHHPTPQIILLEKIAKIAYRGAETAQQTLELLLQYETPEQQTTLLQQITNIARYGTETTQTTPLVLTALTALTPQIQELLKQYTPKQQQILLQEIILIVDYELTPAIPLPEHCTPEQKQTLLQQRAQDYAMKNIQQKINTLTQYQDPLQAIEFVRQYPALKRPYTPKTQEKITETIKFIQTLKPKEDNKTAFLEQLNKIPGENYERDTIRYCNRLQQELKDNIDHLERITI